MSRNAQCLDTSLDAFRVKGMPPEGFASEEEREKFIDGNRERRIQVELAETEIALQKLEALSEAINDKTKQITDFYYALGEKLRGYELGHPFILKDPQNKIKDSHYRLNHTEDNDGNLYFYRLGFARLKDTAYGTWDIVVYKYRQDFVGDGEGKGAPSEVFLEDKTARLTHSSRDIRIAASHIIGAFIQKFLREVSYGESSVDSALKRVEQLKELIEF